MLVDLRGMDISGKELQNRCDEVYITLNKNTVPNDPRSPFVTSGVRIGTPAVTTRGLKEEAHGSHRRVHLAGSYRLREQGRLHPCGSDEAV